VKDCARLLCDDLYGRRLLSLSHSLRPGLAPIPAIYYVYHNNNNNNIVPRYDIILLLLLSIHIIILRRTGAMYKISYNINIIIVYRRHCIMIWDIILLYTRAMWPHGVRTTRTGKWKEHSARANNGDCERVRHSDQIMGRG